jgi:hypothetical protein
MGFSIPDSPPRELNDAATQFAEPAQATLHQGFRQFRQSLAARRRNAIVPGSLAFDALGSPRSPVVFLSQESRRALAQRQEQGQEQGRAKSVPSVRRHGDQGTVAATWPIVANGRANVFIAAILFPQAATNVGTAQNVHDIP